MHFTPNSNRQCKRAVTDSGAVSLSQAEGACTIGICGRLTTSRLQKQHTRSPSDSRFNSAKHSVKILLNKKLNWVECVKLSPTAYLLDWPLALMHEVAKSSRCCRIRCAGPAVRVNGTLPTCDKSALYNKMPFSARF